MTFSADLESLTDPHGYAPTVPVMTAQRQAVHSHPKGWEPGIVYDPTGAQTITVASHQNINGDPDAWVPMVAELGLTVPEGWTVRLVEAKFDPVAWTRDSPEQDKAVTKPVWRYRFRVEQSVADLPIDDLLAVVKKAKPGKEKQAAAHTGDAFVVATGDTQIGKVDGDGPQGTVKRMAESFAAQVEQLKRLRKAGYVLDTVYLFWLGDCIEGFVSQGGANAWRTNLPLTEQVRVVRRLMLEQIEVFRKVAKRVVLVSVPGNHDEAIRLAGKGVTTYTDSWAVEAAVQCGDAMSLNPDAYGHVSVVVPERDELTVTLDVAGTVVGLAHGHQMRAGKAMQWWADQSHGMQPIGDATLLLTAHLHHLKVEQGGAKTVIQTPAFESESTWWRHRAGQVAPTGAVTLTVGGGAWDNLRVV